MQARHEGVRAVSRVTRAAAAGSLLLAALFSVVAAIGYSGHARVTAGRSRTSETRSVAATGGVRVALPPSGDDGALAPPALPPVSQTVPALPPVTSGGS